ncbi:MAG TPA: BCCT family transporter [Halothiobacillaceae bacterium]|nr:BCCT family transporter [Halothiobacillaceae bacterium]
MTTAETKAPRSTILIPVFMPAMIVITLMVIGTISNPELAGEAFSSTLNWITETFGWFYMLAVALFLIFILIVALSKYGDIKLGPDHATPQYSFPAWFAMLFSAGYGIALLFFGVAEPVLHYASPPGVEDPQTIEAAREAMRIAFFHWGFHIWAIYGLVGLVLAYFAFRHGLPLSMRSALYPLIGERIYGPIGHIVDLIAVLGTLFGIATTLGLSVAQLNAGLSHLWPAIPVSTTVQVLAIVGITALAIISVAAGLDKGVKRLSQFNMVLVIGIMLFVFIVGPTLLLLEIFVESTGYYLSGLVERTFSLEAYEGTGWIANWTLFIFGWTIAWAPFVGLFIAKISRGRTIRQFVLGVMLVPTIFTFMWFSVFGGTAFNAIMNEGYEALIGQVQADNAVALFMLYEHLPWSVITSFLSIVLIVTFFVTSSDSGSLVIDSLTSKPDLPTPVWQRVYWASIEGVIAAVLLVAGGLSALQAASITSALPFAIVMLIAAVGMWRALQIEGYREVSLQHHMNAARHQAGSQIEHWHKRLSNLLHFPGREKVAAFIRTDVKQAMVKVEKQLADRGWPVEMEFDDENVRARLTVAKPGVMEFIYEIRLRAYDMPSFAYPEQPMEDEASKQYYRAEVYLRRGGRGYNVYGYDEDLLISDILDQFEKYMHFLHTSPGVLPWKMDKHDEDLDK